jgi:hypothetical protein
MNASSSRSRAVLLLAVGMTADFASVSILAACSGDDSGPPPPSHLDAGGDTGSDVTTDQRAGDSAGETGSPEAGEGGGPTEGGAGEGGEAGLMPFGASTCTQDSDCATGGCFIGGMGTFCTYKCATANMDNAPECIAPTTGKCNMKNYCQVQ